MGIKDRLFIQKEKVDRLFSAKERKQGSLITQKENLIKSHGVKNLRQANEKLEEFETEITINRKKLDKLVQEIEEEL